MVTYLCPLMRGQLGAPNTPCLRRFFGVGGSNNRSEEKSQGGRKPTSGSLALMGFGKDGKGEIVREARSQALGALGASTGIIVGTKLATLEDFRIIKSEVVCDGTSFTAGEGNGLALYLVDGDYSLAEFEEALENNGPLGPNDSVAAAISMRWIKWFGEVVHNGQPTEEELVMINENGGAFLSQTVRWTFARTKSWNWIIYNHTKTITTGASMRIKAKNFGVWVR